jgi:hypothetical protein
MLVVTATILDILQRPAPCLKLYISVTEFCSHHNVNGDVEMQTEFSLRNAVF